MLRAERFQTNPVCAQESAENKSNTPPNDAILTSWKSSKKQGVTLLTAFVPFCTHLLFASIPVACRPGASKGVPSTAGGARSREEGSTPAGAEPSRKVHFPSGRLDCSFYLF